MKKSLDEIIGGLAADKAAADKSANETAAREMNARQRQEDQRTVLRAMLRERVDRIAGAVVAPHVDEAEVPFKVGDALLLNLLALAYVPPLKPGARLVQDRLLVFAYAPEEPADIMTLVAVGPQRKIDGETDVRAMRRGLRRIADATLLLGATPEQVDAALVLAMEHLADRPHRLGLFV